MLKLSPFWSVMMLRPFDTLCSKSFFLLKLVWVNSYKKKRKKRQSAFLGREGFYIHIAQIRKFWWSIFMFSIPRGEGEKCPQLSIQGVGTSDGSGSKIFDTGRVSHLWFGVNFGKYPLKMSNFSIFFPSGLKKSLWVGSESTRVKGGSASYSLRVRSKLGSGPIVGIPQAISPSLPSMVPPLYKAFSPFLTLWGMSTPYLFNQPPFWQKGHLLLT